MLKIRTPVYISYLPVEYPHWISITNFISVPPVLATLIYASYSIQIYSLISSDILLLSMLTMMQILTIIMALYVQWDGYGIRALFIETYYIFLGTLLVFLFLLPYTFLTIV